MVSLFLLGGFGVGASRSGVLGCAVDGCVPGFSNVAPIVPVIVVRPPPEIHKDRVVSSKLNRDGGQIVIGSRTLLSGSYGSVQ